MSPDVHDPISSSSTMRIESPDRKTRILLKDDGTELARISRTSWAGHKAELLCAGNIYEMQTAFLQNKLTLAYQGTTVLEITFPWRGGVRLRHMTDGGRSYIAKQENAWRAEYSLMEEGQPGIARFRFGMDWKRFRERVDLAAGDEIVELCPPWVLLSAIYAVSVKRSRHAAAAA